jgi:hypothetical protein
MAFGGQVVLVHDLNRIPVSPLAPASGQLAAPSSRYQQRGPRAPGPGGTTPNGDRMPVMHAVSH